MFIMQVLASQLPFLANRNAELAVPPLFWPDKCINTGGHVAHVAEWSYWLFPILWSRIGVKTFNWDRAAPALDFKG